MNTLSITCPSCQHTWNIEVPDIPWRALPAYKRVKCPSCHATIRVMVQEKEGKVHVSFHLRV